MNNLTEQWKDGTLKAGAYYILSATGGIFPDSYNPYGYFEQFDSLVKEVLAPVPSYEEFDNVIKCYLCAHEKADRFEKENQKLKALLKEVRGKLKYINTPRNNHNIFGNDLMKKINQILGEDK